MKNTTEISNTELFTKLYEKLEGGKLVDQYKKGNAPYSDMRKNGNYQTFVAQIAQRTESPQEFMQAHTDRGFTKEDAASLYRWFFGE